MLNKDPKPKAAGGKYKFAVTKENYEDYSSGRVLYGATGATGFPVRLVSEVFQRAVAKLKHEGLNAPYCIYDPFCGAAYSLTVVGLLHGTDVGSLLASDISEEALVTAQKNLSLLTRAGFGNRVRELTKLRDTYHKASHREALESAARLEARIPNIGTEPFQFNVLGQEKLPIPDALVDMVLTDLPYGKLTKWEGGEETSPTQLFLNNIRSVLKPNGVVAMSIDKKQKVSHEGYVRLEILRLGKRQVLFLTKNVV